MRTYDDHGKVHESDYEKPRLLEYGSVLELTGS